MAIATERHQIPVKVRRYSNGIVQQPFGLCDVQTHLELVQMRRKYFRQQEYYTDA